LFGVKGSPERSAITGVANGAAAASSERLELVTNPGGIAVAMPMCFRRRSSSSMRCAYRPSEINLPIDIEDGETMRMAVGRAAPPRQDPRAAARATSGGAREPRRATGAVVPARFNENTAAHFDALETLRSGWGSRRSPPEAHRMVRHFHGFRQ